MKPSSHSYLNSLTDHYFDQFTATLVMFLSDDELIFLLLFETMISQSCKFWDLKYLLTFQIFLFLANSEAVFVFVQYSYTVYLSSWEKLPALASLSSKTRARPRAVGEYETCLLSIDFLLISKEKNCSWCIIIKHCRLFGCLNMLPVVQIYPFLHLNFLWFVDVFVKH